jgi:hypothetical protein
MVELYGDNARTRANLRATELRDAGERDAAEIWVQVSLTIEQLLEEGRAQAFGAFLALSLAVA